MSFLYRSASHVIPAEACGKEGIYGRRNKEAKAPFVTALEAIDPKPPRRPPQG